MTLQEWSKMAGVLPTHPTTERGAVSVVYSRLNAHYYTLWRLDDYRVDSVQAGVVWLLPRESDKQITPPSREERFMGSAIDDWKPF